MEAGIAHPLPATRPVRPRWLLVAIALVGLLVVFSPYEWSARYALGGPYVGELPFLLGQLAPYALLLVLAALRPVRSAAGVLVLTSVCALVQLSLSVDLHRDAYATTDALETSAVVLLLGACAGWPLLAERSWLQGPWAWLAAGGLLLALGRIAPVEEWQTGETFAVLFASIVIEALPFVVLGAAVSAGMEVFVPERLFERASRLPLGLQVPAALAGAMAFPVCECGSVPVARRLLLKGMHPAAGLTFMLAAPIVNPVVLFSTYTAYQGRGGLEVVAARASLGLLVAVAIGLLIGRTRAAQLLTVRAGGHAHHHHGGRIRSFSDHISADLLFMGRFVVLGAALAAAAQTIVPQSAFAGLLVSPLVGGLVMMVAGFVLSLCSEADAFVAVSFIQFPIGPQLAFLVLGPILDIKLALLYGATFGRSFVVRLAVLAVPLVLAGSLVAGAVIG